MSDFPHERLLRLAQTYPKGSSAREAIQRAVSAYDQLADRCVMDATLASATIGRLRARIQELEGRP